MQPADEPPPLFPAPAGRVKSTTGDYEPVRPHPPEPPAPLLESPASADELPAVPSSSTHHPGRAVPEADIQEEQNRSMASKRQADQAHEVDESSPDQTNDNGLSDCPS